MALIQRQLISAVGVLIVTAIVGCDMANLPTAPPTPTYSSTASPTLSPTSIPTPTIGPSSFTGTYMADARPSDMEFLSLTHIGTEVNGYLMIVTPDGNMNTEAVTVPLSGSADGDIATLKDKDGRWVYTLLRSENQLKLSYPSPRGQIGSRNMTPASLEQFNRLLDEWQGELRFKGQAYLGVTGTPLNSLNAWLYNYKDENDVLLTQGTVVTSVVPNSPAEWAGIREHDIILKVDGYELAEDDTIISVLICCFAPGETVPFTVLRSGKRLVLEVTLGTRE
jgi:membrane-associated protease RseP (regulator of RpoE activity)